METAADRSNVRIIRLQPGLFGTNAYIIVCRQTGEGILVDAPDEAGRMIQTLEENTPRHLLRYILLTHNHADHTGALSGLRAALGVPVVAHALDARGLPLAPDMLAGDNDTITFGHISIRVLHTPGHTPGSLCFYLPGYLLSGDTIFPGGPGKTRSPASLKQVVESIRDKVMVLPDDTRIYSGHGEATVLKKEKDEFAVFSSRTHEPDLCGDVLWLSS